MIVLPEVETTGKLLVTRALVDEEKNISIALEEGARVDDGGAAAARVEVTASGVEEVGGPGVLDGGIGVELLRAVVDESAAGELVGGGAVIKSETRVPMNTYPCTELRSIIVVHDHSSITATASP